MQNPNGPLQGSPAMDANADFFNNGQMRGMPGAGPAGQNSSNHALQDYQMQLMLLEQQNKKRLLMARQEQDSANGPNGGPMPGFPGAPMSPSNSRTGPSPNPDEQMKRGTPKMAPGIPPNPDGSMPQGRGSPVPGFDPSQMNPNIPPGMFNQMAKMQGMMGGPNSQMNGQMMPATSHPAMMNGQAPPMTQQQTFEMIQQRGVQRPGGPWPQGPPQMMQGQQPPQPPNMTPQQRNAAMPPPPAPPQGEAARTQPSSPSQSQQAPPTPSQTNKANPKGKKEGAKNNKVCCFEQSHVVSLLTLSLESSCKEGRCGRCDTCLGRRRATADAYSGSSDYADSPRSAIQDWAESATEPAKSKSWSSQSTATGGSWSAVRCA